MKKHSEKMVRVITDTRDATRDRFIRADDAEALWHAGKLDMVHAYNNEWTYCAPVCRICGEEGHSWQRCGND